jgi:hypothetical protein
MTTGALTSLKAVTNFEVPKDHHALSRNFARVSFWGALGSSGIASVSFIFSKYLMQEGFCKALASYVFKANLTSCATLAAVGAYCIYNIESSPYAEDLNRRVSFFAKKSALVGLIGAAAALVFQFVTSNALASSLAKHSYLFLGVGTAGLILRIFLTTQKGQLPKKNFYLYG